MKLIGSIFLKENQEHFNLNKTKQPESSSVRHKKPYKQWDKVQADDEPETHRPMLESNGDIDADE